MIFFKYIPVLFVMFFGILPIYGDISIQDQNNRQPKETNQIVERMDDNSEYETYNVTSSSDSKTLARQISQSQGITRINIGTQSKLLSPPGTTVQIVFEVTNLRAEPTLHNFRVTGEQRFLTQMIPQFILLNPSQTQNVVVTAFISNSAEIGTRDKITFYSQSVTLATQSVYLTVSSASGVQDNTKPSISHTYGSRCDGTGSSSNCAGNLWTLEISARDSETGILRLQSSPSGIYYRTAYIAGTREYVSATYSASCCEPKVTITAFDLAGNQNSVSYDVTDVYLDAAGITAVVLGALLIIILIILLVFCIRWCIQKREARVLPVYRTERTVDR